MGMHVGIEKNVSELRAQRLSAGGLPVPSELQGVTKDRVVAVLSRLGISDALSVDAVYALLDDETPSWFSNAPSGASFGHGATTAHLACHIGILQRGGTKLDREGRDYWIKPLRGIGAIEPVLLYEGAFIEGHAVAKSPNSAYRLADSFKAILKAPDSQWEAQLVEWADSDAVRQRHEFQGRAEAASRARIDSGHSALIRSTIDLYVPRFLPGYLVIYVDDGDGDRITDEDKTNLSRAGIELRLGDAMPDVLLWNPSLNTLWVIEAVTSDGEVDEHKAAQLRSFAIRSGKTLAGATTAYRTWREAASRQNTHKNLAIGSHVWIEADPSRTLLVGSFT